VPVPLQCLQPRAAVDRLLLQPDFHELVGWGVRLGTGAAERIRRGKHCLDTDVCAAAACLRLLSGAGFAALAAIYCVVAAAYLCVRGDAGALDGACVSHRLDGLGAGHQCGAAGGFLFGVPCAPAQRPPSGLAARGWRISHFPLDSHGLGWAKRVKTDRYVDALLRILQYIALQNRKMTHAHW